MNIWHKDSWRQALAILVSVFPWTAVAVGSTSVQVVVHGAQSTEAHGRLVASTAGAEGLVSVEAAFTSETTAALELTAGLSWTLQAEAEGFWSPSVLVIVPPDSEGSPSLATRSTILKLYPTTAIVGALEVAGHEDLPDDLRLQARFYSAGSRGREKPALAGTVDCTLAERKLECLVPVGKLDLRLRVSGYVSHFFWDKTVTASKKLDVGLVRLEPGASVTGWVETIDDTPLAECTVKLEPLLSGRPSAADEARAAILTVRELVGERGFFHFTGLVPGSYVLSAWMEGFSPTQVPNLVVMENAEAELRDPLVLEQPLEIALHVIPELDPLDQPWVVTLSPASGGVPVSGGKRWQGRANSEGRWTQSDLPRGSYFLTLRDSRARRMKTEVLELDFSEASFTIEVPLVSVEGRVTLGGEPLEGHVVFGGISAPVSIRAALDEDGHYRTTIPLRDTWPVVVTATKPRVFRHLAAVEVKAAPGSTVAQLDIELDDTLIAGNVVDEMGKAVVNAHVLVMPRGGSSSIANLKTDDEGEFSLRGHGLGGYWLEASVRSGGDKLSSETLETELSEASPSVSLSLVVRRSHELRGWLLSPVGGIPGAQVIAILPPELAQRPFLVLPQTRTSGDGSFTFTVPADVMVLDLMAMAPGFVLKRTRVDLSATQEMEIHLSQTDGGTLLIELPKPLSAYQPGERPPYVVRDGQFKLSVTTLARWAWLNHALEEGASLLRIPLLPPGSYQTCWPEGKKPNPPCTSGFLAAGADLTLSPALAETKPSR